jgi:hypothetical protein
MRHKPDPGRVWPMAPYRHTCDLSCSFVTVYEDDMSPPFCSEIIFNFLWSGSPWEEKKMLIIYMIYRMPSWHLPWIAPYVCASPSWRRGGNVIFGLAISLALWSRGRIPCMAPFPNTGKKYFLPTNSLFLFYEKLLPATEPKHVSTQTTTNYSNYGYLLP